MSKRLWAVILAAAVTLVSAVPVSFNGIQTAAAAANSTSGKTEEDTSDDGKTTAKGYTFKIVGGEAAITGYNGTEKELTIPTKIVVKQTSSGTTTGGSVSTGGSGSSGGSNTSGTEYNVTSIADNAFSEKIGIQSVTMAGGIDKDGKAYGVKKIGDKAFFACHDLAKLTIAPTTTSIGKNAFSDCVALSTVKVEDGNQKYKVIDNVLYSYTVVSGTGAYTLEQYPLGVKNADYKVPDSIATTLTDVGEGAFWGAPNLVNVTLPATVKTVGDHAFYECKKLKTVVLPDDLTSIGEEAFRGAAALEEISIPAGVKAINTGTFQNCESLKKVNMTTKLATIGIRAFQGCKSMTEFEVPAGVTTLGDYAFAQCTALKEIKIPMKTTAIGSGVFNGTTVTVQCHNGSQASTYAKNNGLTVERTYTVAFYSNSTYTSLISSQEIPEGRDAVPPSIDGRNGYDMNWSGSYTSVKQDMRIYPVWGKLFDVKFIDGYNQKEETTKVVEGEYPVPPKWSMSGYTLSWDTDITTAVYSNLTIRAVWTDDATGKVISQNAKSPAAKGTDLTKGNNRYKVNSTSKAKPTVKFVGLVNEKASTVTIPETVVVSGVSYKVTAISAKAVNGNTSITSLVINKNVKSISAKAFFNCKKLKKIKLKTKVITNINNKAFANIHSKAKFYTYNSQISRYRTMLKNAGVKKPTIKRL